MAPSPGSPSEAYLGFASARFELLADLCQACAECNDTASERIWQQRPLKICEDSASQDAMSLLLVFAASDTTGQMRKCRNQPA